MGLDMYLYAKKYVAAYDFSDDLDKQKYRKTVHVFGVEDLVDQETPSLEVSFCVGYWRKANQIHKWFVDNIQKGIDNCGEYYVPVEKLEELLDICKKVKKNPDKAQKLLPTTSGIFFGSSDYDSFYMDDIEQTIEILERVLAHNNNYNFYYSSSW